MNRKKKRPKAKPVKWKMLRNCKYEENITVMIRELFYSDQIDAKKVSAEEWEIWNLSGKIDLFRVRFDRKKENFLFEQKYN